ncbi:MAG TPA: hypothetical protein P5568_08805 [Acidobacteriota bacterium]|nr:hypothetical protein [Acidobacteriota bacterium]
MACLVNGEAAEVKPFMNLIPAVRVPAGVGEIEYRYDPRSWRVGGIVSLAGLAVLLRLFLSPAARRFPNGA